MKYSANYGRPINERSDDGFIGCLKEVFSGFHMMYITVYQDIR